MQPEPLLPFKTDNPGWADCLVQSKLVRRVYLACLVITIASHTSTTKWIPRILGSLTQYRSGRAWLPHGQQTPDAATETFTIMDYWLCRMASFWTTVLFSLACWFYYKLLLFQWILTAGAQNKDVRAFALDGSVGITLTNVWGWSKARKCEKDTQLQ